MPKTKYIIYAAYLTSGILLGVFFCNFSYFTFDRSVKIIDVISIAITSFLGFYIATGVNKAFTKNNSEKELLIGEVKAIIKIVNKLLEAVGNHKIPFTNAVRAFKNINENLILIEKLFKSSHCKDIEVSAISRNLHDLRKLITSISPVAGIIVFDNSNMSPIQASTVMLKTKLYNLIFEINKI